MSPHHYRHRASVSALLVLMFMAAHRVRHAPERLAGLPYLVASTAPSRSDGGTLYPVTSYDYAVLPLFLLMAEICMAAGMGKSLYRLVYVWIGRMRGGLAIATSALCLLCGAGSSSIATAATIGLVPCRR